MKSNIEKIFRSLTVLAASASWAVLQSVTAQVSGYSQEQTAAYAWEQDPNNFRQTQPSHQHPQSDFCFDCRNGNDLETWITFVGIEGSKQPQDLGVNAHVGGRVAVNYGNLLLVLDRFNEGEIGIQLGTSINATANAVQVIERIEGSTSRLQSYSTVGLFRRSENGITWGAGYDILFQDYFDSALLGQWRMEVWHPVLERDEIGVTVALRSRSDEVVFLGNTLELQPLSYGRLNWRRHWESGAYTTFWIGLASSHSEINVALGDLPPTGRQFLFGSDFRCPLNSFLSVYGEANFVLPADTGSVDAFLGIEISAGRCFAPVKSFASRPVLPLAGSPTFIVNARRPP